MTEKIIVWFFINCLKKTQVVGLAQLFLWISQLSLLEKTTQLTKLCRTFDSHFDCFPSLDFT